MASKPIHYKPYPELVDPDPYRGYSVVDIEYVKKSSKELGKVDGQTDKRKRIMAVPLTPDGEYIRRHEMGHAKWSPKDKPRCRSWLMRGCIESLEEMRVNQGLALLGIPCVIPEPERKESYLDLSVELGEGNVVAAALRLVSYEGTNVARYHRMVLDGCAEQRDVRAIWLQTLMKNLHKRMERARGTQRVVPKFSSLQRIARWLEKELRKFSRAEDDPDGEAKVARAGLQMGFGRSIQMKKGMQHQPSTYDGGDYGSWGQTSRYDPKLSPYYGTNWGHTPPGEMHILTPPLTVPVVSPDLERTTKARSAEEGTEFRFIERFIADQRVFKRRAKKRKGGGTVLIDSSGSMHISERDIQRIVEGAPFATTVAVYSGYGREGDLKIVVRNGKKVEAGNFNTRGGSNVIDLPALEWLSCQPEPRVWLSDGGVTGVNDNSNRLINKACDTVKKENNITRCIDVGDVCKALKRDPDAYDEGDTDDE